MLLTAFKWFKVVLNYDIMIKSLLNCGWFFGLPFSVAALSGFFSFCGVLLLLLQFCRTALHTNNRIM